MTLIKSLLLGSAAGIVAVATAQAADLPTRKAAPVEYVRVCNVGGITGWTLPGSDTCVKFSGYITGAIRRRQPQHPVQLRFDRERADGRHDHSGPADPCCRSRIGAPRSGARPSQHSARSASPPAHAQHNTTFNRNQTGWTTRANFGFDIASNTAYGPLIGHFDLNADVANGFDPILGNICLSQHRLSDLGGHHRR